jgi:hypothetical protein
MVLVYNGFSTFILFAAYQTVARVSVGLTEAARRRSERRWLTSDDVRDCEHRPSWSRQGTSRYLPGSVFDARYKGLAGHAACLDAGICRRQRLG